MNESRTEKKVRQIMTGPLTNLWVMLCVRLYVRLWLFAYTVSTWTRRWQMIEFGRWNGGGRAKCERGKNEKQNLAGTWRNRQGEQSKKMTKWQNQREKMVCYNWVIAVDGMPFDYVINYNIFFFFLLWLFYRRVFRFELIAVFWATSLSFSGRFHI